jgi:hypothetical protein
VVNAVQETLARGIFFHFFSPWQYLVDIALSLPPCFQRLWLEQSKRPRFKSWIFLFDA